MYYLEIASTVIHMAKTYGTVRCDNCDQDLINKTQVYDYKDTAKTIRVAYCENCNVLIGKGLHNKHR